MLVLAGYILLMHNLNAWIDTSENKFVLEAYVKDGIGGKALSTLKQQFTEHKDIKGTTLVSKQNARDDFLKKHPDFRDVVKNMDKNPFPASFKLSVKETANTEINRLAAEIAKLPDIEQVEFGGSWREKYVAFLGALRLSGYILATLILLACVFLVSNTIRLNVFTRKDEIEIYKLVGGTRAFIATPFVIEGMLQGLLGALLATIMLYGLHSIAAAGMGLKSQYLIGGLMIQFLTLNNIAFILFVGTCAGLVGSAISLYRFLKF